MPFESHTSMAAEIRLDGPETAIDLDGQKAMIHWLLPLRISGAEAGATNPHFSRRRPDSNRSTGLCRPLPNHSATPPEVSSLMGEVKSLMTF